MSLNRLSLNRLPTLWHPEQHFDPLACSGNKGGLLLNNYTDHKYLAETAVSAGAHRSVQNIVTVTTGTG